MERLCLFMLTFDIELNIVQLWRCGMALRTLKPDGLYSLLFFLLPLIACFFRPFCAVVCCLVAVLMKIQIFIERSTICVCEQSTEKNVKVSLFCYFTPQNAVDDKIGKVFDFLSFSRLPFGVKIAQEKSESHDHHNIG